jgi:spermidine synthase
MLKLVLFCFFLASGFCGLLYQLVWTRLAFASFGVVTPVLSVVISVFMLGLALGSYGGGRFIRWVLTTKTFSTIFLYGAIELGIGVGAFVVPALFSLSTHALLNVGETNSFSYLLLSGVAISLSVFPWCFFMGATFPFMMGFMKERYAEETRSFSFLYLANVLGALLGIVMTALVLIEVLGFRRTLFVGGCLNFAVALSSFLVGFRRPRRDKPQPIPEKDPDNVPVSRGSLFINTVLFTTGFCSLAMEVVWTRNFTPVMGTHVYAFATLLFTYLLATWIGSCIYRSKKLPLSTEKLLGLLSVFAFLPVVMNHPGLYQQGVVTIGKLLLPTNVFPFLASLVPFCATLGFLTPQLIDDISEGNPYTAGKAYACNIVGCILGPLFACYFLLPLLGVRNSLIVLSIPFLVFFVRSFPVLSPGLRWVIAPICTVLLAGSLMSSSYEERSFEKVLRVRRDHAATTLTGGAGVRKWLMVNGTEMTRLTMITQHMGHLPMLLHQGKPTSALVICFGMGTTYRSLLNWGIDVTAIELVPGVKDAFGDFFDDAAGYLKNPKGRIIIDDGRRFLSRVPEKFDVITIDPPPPSEAAGSSLLYSVDFYELAKKRLKPGGILQQWWAYGEKQTVEAVTRSITYSFPYVKVFKSIEGWGFHFIASMSPIVVPSEETMMARIPDKAQKDMLEWFIVKDLRFGVQWIKRHELAPPEEFLKNTKYVLITDDRPFNEYFMLRRLWGYR